LTSLFGGINVRQSGRCCNDRLRTHRKGGAPLRFLRAGTFCGKRLGLDELREVTKVRGNGTYVPVPADAKGLTLGPWGAARSAETSVSISWLRPK